MEKKLYAAYGSNLHLAQMAERCPGAKPLGTGVIRDYALQFKGSLGQAHATIARREGAEVPAVVWELTASDEAQLDRYEGYPSYYFKQEVTVQMGEKEVTAMAYIMDLKMGFGVPAPGYHQTILEGYRDFGLDPGIVRQAVLESLEQLKAAAYGKPEALEPEEPELLEAPEPEGDRDFQESSKAEEELSGTVQGMLP